MSLPSSGPQNSGSPHWQDLGQEEAEGLGWGGAWTCCSPQVKDFTDHTVLPMDGATLAEVMRQRGINMRLPGQGAGPVMRPGP